jgi:hypothetical protein
VQFQWFNLLVVVFTVAVSVSVAGFGYFHLLADERDLVGVAVSDKPTAVAFGRLDGLYFTEIRLLADLGNATAQTVLGARYQYGGGVVTRLTGSKVALFGISNATALGTEGVLPNFLARQFTMRSTSVQKTPALIVLLVLVCLKPSSHAYASEQLMFRKEVIFNNWSADNPIFETDRDRGDAGRPNYGNA